MDRYADRNAVYIHELHGNRKEKCVKKTLFTITLFVLYANLAGCQNKKDLEEVQAIYDNLYPDMIKAMKLVYADGLELVQEITDENGNSYR